MACEKEPALNTSPYSAPVLYRDKPGPLHALLLASTVPLFLGALLADIAYFRSYHIQWSNFAAWLIAGALVCGGFALLFALVGLFRGHQGSRPLGYFLLLLAAWLLGFINALQHARDAWAVMPLGLVLSLIVTLLALIASWIALSGFDRVQRVERVDDGGVR